MLWKPDDEFVVTHPSAPFYGARGVVDNVNRPFPYPIQGAVETPDGWKPCWWRLDEISPAEVDAPTEQIPAVTG
jgi:hypothetical protein